MTFFWQTVNDLRMSRRVIIQSPLCSDSIKAETQPNRFSRLKQQGFGKKNHASFMHREFQKSYHETNQNTMRHLTTDDRLE